VIPYTPENVFNLNLYSLVGFVIMGMLFLGFAQICLKVFKILYQVTERPAGYLVSLLFGLALLLVVDVLFIGDHWPEYFAFLFFSAGFWLLRERPGKNFFFLRLVFGLFFFSVIGTYLLQQTNDFKEKEKRKSLAQKLSASQDPIAEYLYVSTENDILSDSVLLQMMKEYPQSENETKDYLFRQYFRGYWDKYQLQITLCNRTDSLFIKPAMVNKNCNDYFNELLDEFGKKTTSENLYMLNYGTGGNSYLSILGFMVDSTTYINAYIELYSKFIPKGLGYPELLIDKKIFLNTDLSNYSYARYRNKQLVDAYGKYYYSINQDPRDTLIADVGFFERNGYDHLFYRIDKSSNLIISGKKFGLLEKAAPFSLLFLFFALLFGVFFLVSAFPYRNEQFRLNFKNRLQVSMVAMILISFVLIGVSMYYYIRKLNDDKNLENLSEKALSILIETQAKLAEYDSLTPDLEAYMSTYLVKFSNVFFSDINLFDLNGMLISSSRPQVFNEGLLADRMDPEAYKELAINKKTIFIHKEKIGDLEYYSAYMPFYNYQNKLTAYLNLPYFARENELQQELSTFMMTFINIYVFLVAIAVIIALLIAGRMTRPLKEIREKIGRVRLGGRNEKIIWTRQMDEIGSLVNEYNRMIDELALSAELLARSER
jgi:HAMP domain-containing protein